MKFSDMSTIDQLDYMARHILVLSIAYYDLDTNLVEDKIYDRKLKYLCESVDKHKDVLYNCYYYDVLKDIHPSTGFDLAYKISEEHRVYLTKIAQTCIKLKGAR